MINIKIMDSFLSNKEERDIVLNNAPDYIKHISNY